ncbi:MAG: hypothetical protein A2268_04890 [Candidatus Raymondbacteria bacterium RifOxyA12_full_50_37]|uniref:Phosphohydrolase n=1 Tax=Candidatus Raymondbacteria bacterium RIFOXYD12_FULL_49_13 TaxID=1817890 RepID=A0A1F7FDP1_UNCRA|nr:MAG: hypothetical protein A2268_04890 [Candidatus Raymondbacteria bacterium RifOxyA12_full_50_37]OGJ94081.1 MAG: hypothetical protein A2248_12095 [Candidatus Raymondbacteria bacterium RIFOXYA2_FULL_49_16]OGJ96836.1 MAG: hypothetical protein A2487_07185 [Candidatus Raymondbacteria bacterium RifOxyC12_full_50_8]OGJ96906.1 MAG: hypothetical protein A2453_04695 [Candidatus Raymondbacteria bacterium RIFOXYC2_FULL_50_21]OGK01504.1 MAG: hypothetical protein A2350_07645 [Candidatus Raymondbacteria b
MAQSKKDIAYKIIRHLHADGCEAYLVGGCVRDMVMHRPIADFDIATSAPPEQVMRLFPHTVAVGAQFGVVLVLEGDNQFEVATFRADDRYIDGRRPESVRFVSAREDVMRRDFTINGLLFDIIRDKVIDYIQGLDDIASKTIRTIGDPLQRFDEDKLRLMRAIRFAARFDFIIEKNTWSALTRTAPGILAVSWERIRDELLKMLLQQNTVTALELLFASGLLLSIAPEIHALKGVRQPEEFHPEGDVYDHTLKMFRLLDTLDTVERNETLVLAILLHDIGKPATFREAEDRIRFHNHNYVGSRISGELLKRWRIPNDTIKNVCHIVNNHMNFINAPKMRQNRLKRFIRHPVFAVELDLHRLDCLASHGDLSTYDFLKRKIQEFGNEKISPPPLLTGKQLLEMGYAPGPRFKEMLTAVEDLQLEETIQTFEEAEQFVRTTFPLDTK